MYVYRTSDHQIWTVGHYQPTGKWTAESEHTSPVTAAARVAWLNGQPGICPHCGRTVAKEVYDFDRTPLLLGPGSRIAECTHPEKKQQTPRKPKKRATRR